MVDPIQLEEFYSNFIKNLPQAMPDGVLDIDLKILEKMGLLTQEELETDENHDQFPHYFHVIETPDKVTLFNHQFAIWITPQVINDVPTTLTLIALIHSDSAHLELGFSTSGVYNTPKFVLRILRFFLSEVIDTEAIISSIDKT
ncbi:MAG: hypothetical protein FJZ63_03240 [Chlamydiae bacterium]|nr:hypothetical protein [Chlamydiota bacterium]